MNDSIRVSVAEFASEYWPGPMEGTTYIPGADRSEDYRPFKLSSDSMSEYPNRDYLEWPAALGAPVDSSGEPVIYGDQLVWCVFNDAHPNTHIVNAGNSVPLGVEVRQSVWASSAPGYGRVIFIRYDLFNKGVNDIDSMYVGFFYDPDIGGASDDLTGCDTSRNMFYSYNADNDDFQYGAYPPALGIRLIHGPVVPSVGDSGWHFGNMIADYRSLGLSSYVAYPNGDDPQSAGESYHLLRGLRRNGFSLPDGTTYSYSGDPVIGTGYLDMNPGNPHGLGASGPFSFSVGDSQSILIKIGIGQGGDRLESITNLRSNLTPSDSIIDNRDKSIPTSFVLHQNYPNPFNGSTVVRYDIASPAHATLDIVNVLGQKVRTLASGFHLPGRYSTEWHGTDACSRPLASGVYYCRLRTRATTTVRKMVLLK